MWENEYVAAGSDDESENNSYVSLNLIDKICQ